MQEGVAFCPSFSCYSNESVKVVLKVCEEAQSLDPGSDSDFEFFPQVPEEEASPDALKDSMRMSASPPEKVLKGGRTMERGVDELSSSSESEMELEVDEIERASWANHCAWRFNSSPRRSPPLPPSPGRCKKSNSTGSSVVPTKAKTFWNLKDLLRRSRSDGGKDSYVLTRTNPTFDSKKPAPEKTEPVRSTSKKKWSAHEEFYVKNKALHEHSKRRSFLPYRRDIVGFLYSLNGFGKTFTPF